MAKVEKINIKQLVKEAKQAVVKELETLANDIKAEKSTLNAAYLDVTGEWSPEYGPLHAKRPAQRTDSVPYSYKTNTGIKTGMRRNYNAKRVGSNPNFETNDRAFYKSKFQQREALHRGMKPRFKFITEIDKEKLTLSVRIESLVYNNQGQINNLWYWRDRGTNAFTQVNTSPFSTSGGQLRRSVAGASRSGMRATRWSATIAERQIKHLMNKFKDIEVVSTEESVPWNNSPLYKKLK